MYAELSVTCFVKLGKLLPAAYSDYLLQQRCAKFRAQINVKTELRLENASAPTRVLR